jgi:BirA family biotin operon repressor/biotin-[acetyl-CoA-carboxylase] ligase
VIVATTNQTAGRGRAGRSWSSPPGKNLCFSLYLATVAPPLRIPALSMATALAVDDTMLALRINSQPKWPNDIRVSKKKICGILSERVSCGDISGAIIGVGINVNMSLDEIGSIDQPATSILVESGQSHAPAKILDLLLPHLDKRINAWFPDGFSGIREDWTRRAEGIGERVEIRDASRTYTGILRGFGQNGECLLLTPGGDIISVWAGDMIH